MSRFSPQTRSMASELRAEQTTDDMYIEGYFAVYNVETELWPGAFEEIAPGAFSRTISSDIRALINHETMFVLGRTKSKTLELKEDSRGLWGRVKINPNDSDAVNVYERVKRGDVDQCSFGFEIVSEKTDWRDDGSVKWTLEEVNVYEVSICTFPAYEETGIQARKKDVESNEKRKLESIKMKLRGKLNAKTADA